MPLKKKEAELKNKENDHEDKSRLPDRYAHRFSRL